MGTVVTAYPAEVVAKYEIKTEVFSRYREDGAWRSYCKELRKQGFKVKTTTYSDFRAVEARRPKWA